MARELPDESELLDALGETERLVALGNRSTGPAPPPIWGITPGLPAPATGWGAAPQPVPMTPLGPDVLALDGTRMAVLGGRKFELSNTEMKRVIAAVEKAYARAMKGELQRVRESVLGTKNVRAVQETTGTGDSQNVRVVSRPRVVEITDGSAAGSGAVSELRSPQSGTTQVLNMFGEEEGGGVEPLGASLRPPRSGAEPGATARVPLRHNRAVAVPTPEGGGASTGGSD